MPLPPAVQAKTMNELRAWGRVEERARPSHRTVTGDELRALAASPGISIGAHAAAHAVLALLSSAEQRHELVEARAALQLALGKLVTKVAYPYGTGTDVSRNTMRAAHEAGFDTGYSNTQECAWRGSNRWRVPRILVRDWDAAEFTRKLGEWWAL
jgi:peptidoglycan/xylan/chitin deacetylase (PgdA/CDA1 family)